MVGTSFEEASKVTTVDSHTYEVDLKDDWAIGSVPHGGYVTAIFLRTAAQHFSSTLSKQNQPHCLALHLSFLRRTAIGHARLTIQDMKVGGQTSTVHITLSQPVAPKPNPGNTIAAQLKYPTPKPAYRPCIAGYLTHANLQRPFTGGLSIALDLPTNWKLDPAPPSVDLPKLAAGTDPNWSRMPAWQSEFRRAYTRFEVHGPRAGQPGPSIIDEWVRLENGQRITQAVIGVVADMFPLIIENFREKLGTSGTEEEKKAVEKWPQFWCPTVVLNLEVKKVLPEEGVEWIFVRVRTKEVKGGKMDYEVVVMDESGDLVALSHHVILVLGAERNLAKRGQERDGSKM